MANLKELKEPKFKSSTIEDYNRFVSAVRTQDTGFLEFKPRDIQTQVKYDAMSPVWEGIESTNKAIARGDYALDSADPKRLPTVVAEPSRSYCVIQ